MSDKFRRTEPVNITLAPGEQPTYSKLNAITTQSRNGSRVLEKAIGDPWTQSGDTILTGSPLQIANLARVIGQQKSSSPIIFAPDGKFTFIESVGTKNLGKKAAELVFKPDAIGNITAVGGSTNLTDKKTTLETVVNAGDWFVDVSTGRLFTFSAMDATDKLSYISDPSEWIFTEDILPNIIPDPRQTEFTSCKISTSASKFYIHLPPRRPLPLTGNNRPDRYPTTGEITDNLDTASVVEPTRKLWQSGTVDAITDSFYRYRLPKELDDIVDALSVGDALPTGFLHLWDLTNGTIIEDAVFKKSATRWVFEVVTNSIDLTSYATSGEDPDADYAGRFAIISVGAPVARLLQVLLLLALNHDHSDKSLFSAPLSNYLPVLDGEAFLDGQNVSYGWTAQNLHLFGDGSDGDVTISSGTTTLTRDMYYRNLTISGTGSLNTAGFRVFVSETLDLSAAPVNAIHHNGNAGGNGGNYSSGLGAGGGGGGSGGGVLAIFAKKIQRSGSTAVGAINVSGGAGGNGGLALSAVGTGDRTGGAAGASAVSKTVGGSASAATPGGTGGSLPSNATHSSAGIGNGGAGGNGGPSLENVGSSIGSPGLGGTVTTLPLHRIETNFLYGATLISGGGSGGGGGGAGTEGGGGEGGGPGGGGGGGGWIYVVVGELLGSTATSALKATGGDGGDGDDGLGIGLPIGIGGDGGSGGRITIINLSINTYTETVGSAGEIVDLFALDPTIGGAGGACLSNL